MKLQTTALAAILATVITFHTVPIKSNVGSSEPITNAYSVRNLAYVPRPHTIIIPGDSYFDKQLADFLLDQKIEQVKVAPDRQEIRNQIYKEASERWGREEAIDVLWVVNFESGFNPLARNGNCCGLGQRLDHCSEDYFNNVEGQITDTLNYIQDRYGLPSIAKQHELDHRWY